MVLGHFRHRQELAAAQEEWMPMKLLSEAGTSCGIDLSLPGELGDKPCAPYS
jgi:hypothetical protein